MTETTTTQTAPEVEATPAPWLVSRGAYGALRVGPAVLPHPGRDNRYLVEALKRRERDAALIAVAPRMLRALDRAEERLQVCAYGGDEAEALDEIGAVLKLARGR